MSDKSGIECCDATWNPIVACTRVSEGYRNCYAERAAKDLGRKCTMIEIEERYCEIAARRMSQEDLNFEVEA